MHTLPHLHSIHVSPSWACLSVFCFLFSLYKNYLEFIWRQVLCETEGVWTGSDVRKLGAKRMQPPLSFRTRVFIVSGAHSFNASPICGVQGSHAIKIHTLFANRFWAVSLRPCTVNHCQKQMAINKNINKTSLWHDLQNCDSLFSIGLKSTKVKRSLV